MQSKNISLFPIFLIALVAVFCFEQLLNTKQEQILKAKIIKHEMEICADYAIMKNENELQYIICDKNDPNNQKNLIIGASEIESNLNRGNNCGFCNNRELTNNDDLLNKKGSITLCEIALKNSSINTNKENKNSDTTNIRLENYIKAEKILAITYNLPIQQISTNLIYTNNKNEKTNIECKKYENLNLGNYSINDELQIELIDNQNIDSKINANHLNNELLTSNNDTNNLINKPINISLNNPNRIIYYVNESNHRVNHETYVSNISN